MKAPKPLPAGKAGPDTLFDTGPQAPGVITAVSLQGNWVKLLQARLSEKGPAALLGVRARKVAAFGEEAWASALTELVRTLPVHPKQVVGLLSAGEILTRYLTLPSDKPEELKAMALYQLEGVLPFPILECVTSVKSLGAAGEATRVLVAAVHRPVVERLLRVCRKAGLDLTAIVTSSEAIGQWHRACWPEGTASSVCLVAELTQAGVDLGVLVQGELVYMRQVPPVGRDLEELAAHLHETIQAYAREQVGPPVKQVSLSGAWEGIGLGTLERLEVLLELPIRRIDPLERSPFREALSVTVQEFSPEVSFSELLGVACAPRLLGLDLLPIEARWQQVKTALLSQARQTALCLLLAVALGAGWMAARMGGTWWLLRQTKTQMQWLVSDMERVQAMVATLRAVGKSRVDYGFQLECLGRSTKSLAAGMTLQFIGLEADRALTLRGSAPDLESVTRYSKALRSEPSFQSVSLQSAKTHHQKEISHVEFEILIKPKPQTRSAR